MKESHGKGLASHSGPESCGVDRKVAAEALTGENADQVLSCEIKRSGAPTPLTDAEGNTGEGANGEPSTGSAQSENVIPWQPDVQTSCDGGREGRSGAGSTATLCDRVTASVGGS